MKQRHLVLACATMVALGLVWIAYQSLGRQSFDGCNYHRSIWQDGRWTDVSTQKFCPKQGEEPDRKTLPSRELDALRRNAGK